MQALSITIRITLLLVPVLVLLATPVVQGFLTAGVPISMAQQQHRQQQRQQQRSATPSSWGPDASDEKRKVDGLGDNLHGLDSHSPSYKELLQASSSAASSRNANNIYQDEVLQLPLLKAQRASTQDPKLIQYLDRKITQIEWGSELDLLRSIRDFYTAYSKNDLKAMQLLWVSDPSTYRYHNLELETELLKNYHVEKDLLPEEKDYILDKIAVSGYRRKPHTEDAATLFHPELTPKIWDKEWKEMATPIPRPSLSSFRRHMQQDAQQRQQEDPVFESGVLGVHYDSILTKDYNDEDDGCECIHPGMDAILGRSAILRAWKRLFYERTTQSQQYDPDRPDDMQRRMRITPNQNTFDFNTGRYRRDSIPHQSPNVTATDLRFTPVGTGVTMVRCKQMIGNMANGYNVYEATNVFRRQNGKWKIQMHAASRVIDPLGQFAEYYQPPDKRPYFRERGMPSSW